MTQLKQTFDASKIEPNNYGPLPTGEYIALIEFSEIKETKAKNGHYLALTLQILQPVQYSGRKLWENLNLENQSQKAVEIAQGTLSSICRAVNVMEVTDSEQLHNKPFRILVGIDKKDETQNRIKSYKKIDDSAEPSIPPAPVGDIQVPPQAAPAAAAPVAPWSR